MLSNQFCKATSKPRPSQVRAYIHAPTHMYIHNTTYAHKCRRTPHVYVHVRAQMYTHISVRMNQYTHTCIHTYPHHMYIHNPKTSGEVFIFLSLKSTRYYALVGALYIPLLLNEAARKNGRADVCTIQTCCIYRCNI